LPAAIDDVVEPTAFPSSVHQPASMFIATIESAPTKLPMYTISHTRSKRVAVTWPLATAISMRLFPVNSSAPAITTKIRPSENATPASHLVTPKPRELSVPTKVARTAPRPMNTPARTPSTNAGIMRAFALATPRVRTRFAISTGEKASMPVIG
jgi:hypothetical protein